MKKHCLPLFIALLSVLPCYGDTKSATVDISATLVESCEAGSSTGGNATGVDFGTLDFGSVAFLDDSVTAVGQPNAGAIRIKCTNGTAYTIRIDGGQSGSIDNRQMSNTTTGENINYNLYTDSAHSFVWDNTTGVSATSDGQEVWIPIYGLVPTQATPAAGMYTDTVNVTIDY